MIRSPNPNLMAINLRTGAKSQKPKQLTRRNVSPAGVKKGIHFYFQL